MINIRVVLHGRESAWREVHRTPVEHLLVDLLGRAALGAGEGLTSLGGCLVLVLEGNDVGLSVVAWVATASVAVAAVTVSGKTA